MLDTHEWLKQNLKKLNSEYSPFTRNGSLWEYIYGFKQYGVALNIYTNGYIYCAHAGDDWLENTEPLFGYFDINLDYDTLVYELAKKYDEIRDKVIIF